jgi:hypothetical protein
MSTKGKDRSNNQRSEFTSFEAYLDAMEAAKSTREAPSEYYLLGAKVVEDATANYQTEQSLTMRSSRRS